ncbi:MAG: benzoate 1,2-dioxygenase small subunit [Rhodobacteraceae bacterium]|jgi:benzoate/toluate 1,2-dioxygenase beta subunit|nr:benzoate 1,2-dioxygenase small subunit [Paracoccaceae bacterium]
MNAVTETTLSHDAICAFLYAEARALDDRRFDEWIQFYHPDCPFWMPAWDDYDTLTEDPANEMSLIHYPNRGGIEDRVIRINTDRSSATSLPEPRTGHNITNVEVLSRDGPKTHIRFNWMTHNYRYGTTDTYWGTSLYTVDTASGGPLITSKKVILKNDRIHHVIDVYHI